MHTTYKNTLNLVPSGIMIMDIKSKEVVFSNEELKTIVCEKDESAESINLTEDIKRFQLYEDQEEISKDGE